MVKKCRGGAPRWTLVRTAAGTWSTTNSVCVVWCVCVCDIPY